MLRRSVQCPKGLAASIKENKEDPDDEMFEPLCYAKKERKAMAKRGKKDRQVKKD